MNNIKQIGLALHNYARAMRAFPPGCITTESTSYDPWTDATSSSGAGKHGTSWMLMILPYIEQSQIYDNWDFTTNVMGNAALAQRDIATFYCPSRRSELRGEDQPRMPNSNWTGGGTDYGGCAGGGNFLTNSPPHRWVSTNSNDSDREYWFYRERLGIFRPNRSSQFRSIRDGTSKTLMVGELQRVTKDSGASPPIGDSSQDGWAAGAMPTLFATNNDETPGSYQTGGINNFFFENPGSEHEGGAQFGLADGSVRFLSENMDSLTFRFLGAMNDGEVVNVPE
jgi:hypothetical protein